MPISLKYFQKKKNKNEEVIFPKIEPSHQFCLNNTYPEENVSLIYPEENVSWIYPEVNVSWIYPEENDSWIYAEWNVSWI